MEFVKCYNKEGRKERREGGIAAIKDNWCNSVEHGNGVP